MDDQIPALSDRELLVRIDTKLDGVIEDKKDHEARLRKLEEERVTEAQRLGQMEEKINRAVTPKMLWLGAASVIAAFGALFPVVLWVINK